MSCFSAEMPPRQPPHSITYQRAGISLPLLQTHWRQISLSLACCPSVIPLYTKSQASNEKGCPVTSCSGSITRSAGKAAVPLCHPCPPPLAHSSPHNRLEISHVIAPILPERKPRPRDRVGSGIRDSPRAGTALPSRPERTMLTVGDRGDLGGTAGHRTAGSPTPG